MSSKSKYNKKKKKDTEAHLRTGEYIEKRLNSFKYREVRASQYFPDEFDAWVDMMRKCYDPMHPKFIEEGAKGISVCKEWRDDLLMFYRDTLPWKNKALPVETLDN